MTFALGKYIIRILHDPSAVKKDAPGGKSREMLLCLSREYYFCCFRKSDLHHQKLMKLETSNQIKGNQAKYDTATQNLVRSTQSQNILLEGKDEKIIGVFKNILIGVRTMEADSSMNPHLTLLARWVFIVTIILVLSTFPLYDCSRHFQPRHVPLVSKEATFSKCSRAEQNQYVKPKSQPATGTMFDEPRGLSTISLAATKCQLNEPKTILSSGHAKKRGRNFHLFIAQAASRHHLDPALIKAIIMAESSFDPTAISRKGAKGLMQLMPKTAKALGVEDVFNPEDNINAGVRYLKVLMNRFDGDVRLALAAYNAGSRKVKEFQGIPPIKTTHEYIKKVLEYHLFYKEQES